MTEADDSSAVLPADTLTKTSKSRLFPCVGYEGCSMSFTRSEHLARHMRKHTGERPFACCFCSKHFSRLDNLRQHKLTVHADDMTRSDSGFGMRNNIYNGSVYAEHLLGYAPMPNVGGYIRCNGPAYQMAYGHAVSPDPYDRAPLGAWSTTSDPLHMIQSPLPLQGQIQGPYGYCYQQSPTSAGHPSGQFSPSCNPPIYHPETPGPPPPPPPANLSPFQANPERCISAPVAPQFTPLHFPNYPNFEHSMPDPDIRPLKPMRAPFKPKKRPKHLNLPGQRSYAPPNNIISASPSYAAGQIGTGTANTIEQSAYRTPVLGTLKEFHMSDRLLVHSAPAHQTSFNPPTLRPCIKEQIDKSFFGNNMRDEKISNDSVPSSGGITTTRIIVPSLNSKERGSLGLPLSPEPHNSLDQTSLPSGFTLPTGQDFEPAPIFPPTSFLGPSSGQLPPSLPPIVPHPKEETALSPPASTPKLLTSTSDGPGTLSRDKLPSIKNMLTTDHGFGSNTSGSFATVAYEAPF